MSRKWFILLLAIASTSAVRVRRIDGINVAETTVTTNNGDTLKDLRAALTGSEFIGEQSGTHDWKLLKRNNEFLSLDVEKYINIDQFVEDNGEPIEYTNVLNKMDRLEVRIQGRESETIALNKNEKLEKVREQLNRKGYLGSQAERCVKWRFHLRDTKFVTDESELTVAQYLENGGEDHIEVMDYYKQGKSVELWVYKGLEKLLVEKVPLTMNLYDFRMVISGNGTCHGKRNNYLSDEWVTLKKTADLSQTAAGSPEFQISPDLVFSQPEEQSTTVGDAHFVSESGKDSIEYVSKKAKGNIIGQVVSNYVKQVPTKVTMTVYKNTYCKSTCNEGVTLDPVMLDHVQSTNTEIWFASKVVVCEKNTAIGFEIDTQPRTPFWIIVKHDTTDELIVNTRGDHGIQKYFAHNHVRLIVVDSYIIEKEADLLNRKYLPTYSVQIFSLVNNNPRRRRDTREGDGVTLPKESHDDGVLKPGGAAHTGPGTDAGYGPGRLITEFQFTLLTFKSSDIAQEIMGRAVSRRKQKHM